MENILRAHLNRRARGENTGICSVCSASELVLRAALACGKDCDAPVLIEATANQVNQFGGYTGMTPADFMEMALRLVAEEGFPAGRLIVGGDHLGPLTWQDETAASAMAKAEELVRMFALAGYGKIHIDTSMRLGDDDPAAPLAVSVVAARSAALARAAEDGFAQRRQRFPDAMEPVYVIGSEVPVPGGAKENESSVAVTSVEDFRGMMDTFRETYARAGLSRAWERVIAVVVQPGVEFSDDSVVEYDGAAARNLTAALADYPGLVFEGHSTDYQTEAALAAMVRDGIAILKVGPALTFALREGLFMLEGIERELCEGALSDFRAVLDECMLADDKYWKKYYRGTEREIAVKRAMSYSDRCRYYMGHPRVREATQRLFHNLRGVRVPLSVLRQYMPEEYAMVRAGALAVDPEALARAHVGLCLKQYGAAARG